MFLVFEKIVDIRVRYHKIQVQKSVYKPQELSWQLNISDSQTQPCAVSFSALVEASRGISDTGVSCQIREIYSW